MLDQNMIFSDAQAITANATTADSTNVIDLGALVDDRGTALNEFGPKNGRIHLNITVNTAPSAGTGIKAELYDCATEGGTYKATGIGLNDAIPNATLIAGYRMLSVALPPGLMRYLKVVYTTTGNHTGSTGKLNAFLSFGSMSENLAPYRA